MYSVGCISQVVYNASVVLVLQARSYPGKHPMQEWTQLLCSYLFIVINWTSICTVFHKTQTALIATTSKSFPDSVLWHPSMTICCSFKVLKKDFTLGHTYHTMYFLHDSVIFYICHDASGCIYNEVTQVTYICVSSLFVLQVVTQMPKSK